MSYQVSIKHNNGHNAKLLNKLYQYYLEEKLVDVTFICSEHKQIKTHSLILSTMSPFFNDLFKFKEEGQLYILLPNTPMELLQNFLEFLYKGNATIVEDSLSDFFKLIQYFHIEGIDDTELLDKNLNSSYNEGNEPNQELETQELNPNTTQLWRPPSVGESINESYTEDADDTQLNTSSSSIEKLRKLTIPLVNFLTPEHNKSNPLDKTNSNVVTSPSSVCTEPIWDHFEGTETEIDDEKTEPNNCVGNLDTIKNTVALDISDSIQIIEEDIPLIVLQDTQRLSLENKISEQDTRINKKKLEECESPIPKKICKYNNNIWNLESDTSSEELICASPQQTSNMNETLDTDELFLKSLQLMKRK